MKFRYIFFCFFLLITRYSLYAQENAKFSITVTPQNELIIVTRTDFHQQYGLAYPVTYQLDFPSGLSGLKVIEKHQTSERWIQIPEKFSSDLFNAIEDVRFDYISQRAYISAAFNGNSDSLFIEIEDSLGNSISFVYQGISKYYDNRKAVVTATSDDYADWNYAFIAPLIYMFRSRGLYLTVGIITAPDNCSNTTWKALQKEVDSGYVEAASHSRTHPFTPYANAVSEVQGSELDIKQNLALPTLFSNNGTGYVYTWIAPYGDYDPTIDYLLGASGYLAARLYANLDTTSPRIYVYGDSTLTDWNINTNHFDPFLPTVELGAPSWGGGDTSLTSLNGLFDTILAKGDIYHLMWHPQVIISDTNKEYLINHLNYISSRSNVWYVNIGHLYLYHMVQSANNGNEITTAIVSKNGNRAVSSFKLFQNYPNPFNPSTIIKYSVPKTSLVSIKVYDILGKEVSALVNEEKPVGNYSVQFFANSWDASGVYFCRMQAGSFVETKKLLLLK
jgi:hypothetical protein